MCRAAGIPSRTAFGLVYVDKPRPSMGFHMWAEAYVKGQWLPIDGTLGRGFVGVHHFGFIVEDQSAAIVIASVELSNMILLESSLSFLGLGVQPPTPSWGNMLGETRNYLMSHWWLATFPGIAIAITAVSINLAGDWLRDALDPHLVT